MIARFVFLLPYRFSIDTKAKLSPFEFERNPHRIRIFPPFAVDVSPLDTDVLSSVTLKSIADKLIEGAPQKATECVQIDGAPTIQANALQIDLINDQFERVIDGRVQQPPINRPLVQMAFEIANDFLLKIRCLTKGFLVTSLNPQACCWRMEFLDDQGSKLLSSPGFYRTMTSSHFDLKAVGINKEIWEKFCNLPNDYRPTPWETLLLDAEALLPEVGPSLVVVYAALEVLISWTLDSLSKIKDFSPELWKWIIERDRNQDKTPSVEEQFDILLKYFSGKTLKDEKRLWEKFINLRSARNKFCHKGRAMIGGEEVTCQKVVSLINDAKEIAAWVENLLPMEARRLALERPIFFAFQKRLQ